MVQRKLPYQLGIQADKHGKSEKLLGNLKPNSNHHHQDGKTRGPDMKKRIKRSRSIKLSDTKGSNSTKQPTDGSPNYMKSTTCSEARKERTQVSSSNNQSRSDAKDLRRRCSNVKSMRGSIRTSSLKKVRTLTRTPSFKPIRGSNRTSSRVSLPANDVRKATCSSTLKDSKFPNYLLLDPGGTEAEGTSAAKVCPYTYCSLNGHHREPLPQLKSFLKVRRRSLKAQKSMTLEILSPRRVKGIKVGMDDLDVGMQEDGADFFVEIYAKGSKSDDGTTQETNNISNKLGDSGNGNLELTYTTVSLSEQSCVQEMNMDEDDASNVPGKEAILEGFDSGNRQAILQRDLVTSFEGDVELSDATDMEWEEGDFSALQIDNEAANHPMGKLESNVDSIMLISDDDHSECSAEILADDVLKELFEEENAYSNVQCKDGNSVIDSGLQNWDCSECSNTERAPEELKIGNEEGAEIETDHAKISLTLMVETIIADENIQDGVISESEGNSVDSLQNLSGNQAEVENNERQPYDTESAQYLIISLSSQEDIMLNNATTDVMEDEKQEANGECLSTSGISDPARTCSEPDPLDSEVFNIGEVVEECNPAAVNNLTSVRKPNLLEEIQNDANSLRTLISLNEKGDLIAHEVKSIGNNSSESTEKTELEAHRNAATTENSVNDIGKPSIELERVRLQTGRSTKTEAYNTSNSMKWSTRCKKPAKDLDEGRNFNPREPNFLPVIPDPESEKVDLKHQTIDDRKNSEEWMLDYALRQAVTKLAPARKRKVALLVEAFETVQRVPKYEAYIRNMPTIFSPTATIQACS